MNSLRARLIAGFSLVAVVPLALALLLLEQRIRHSVREQTVARMDVAIGAVQGELATHGERLAARLELLAREPRLKRLHLVSADGGLELRRHLEDTRFLLGLDYLAVADTGGRVVADASLSPQAAGSPVEAAALPAVLDSGLAVVPLRTGGALVLDARAIIRYDGEPVGLVRGGLRLDSPFLTRLQRASGLELLLRDAGGRVLAGTLAGGEAPAARAGDTDVGRVRVGGRAYFTRETGLWSGDPGRETGVRLVALAPAAQADDAIAVLRATAATLGGLGVLLAVVLGIVWSHQVARPVVRLAGVSERLARGEWDEPVELESLRELSTLVDALERMRVDLRAYRDHLRASERQAAYGQMARRVAHEIKNPLTPIALSVSGLQRAYRQGHEAFPEALDQAVRTVTEEVGRLKTLLQDFAELGRLPPPRPEDLDAGELLGDLAALHAHDVEAGRLRFERPPGPLRVRADHDQVRRALLNLVQNALEASAGAPAGTGPVRVSATAEGASLRLEVRDDGPGLTDEQRANLFVPGFTTKAHGSGLGLTLVERIVADHGGTIAVESAPGRGTTIVVRIPRTVEG
jgi:nitrogen fixation/metabolism regulation signal transduction histidine kinase